MADERTNNNFNKVEGIFSKYLEKHKLRRTPERFAILKEIYSRNDHFEADILFSEIRDKELNVSRATVYNTLELLVSCDLVRKHQFGKNLAQFEKSYGYKQHDHMICVQCNKVVEFCDPRIQQIQTMMGDILEFKVTHHSLNLYGVCATCQQLEKLNQSTDEHHS